ncbi:hypothetical protein [Marinobacter caseinilyticus]|uniref:hypothetical protein n=1 Tax=Marinobacter caseinilyticus TaxID=2692195 RepID=UPI001408EFDC|nr:hypothetical protein [Marinobacter caseinilyticus]
MIPTCFCESYVVSTRSRRLEKLGVVVQILTARGLARLTGPGILDIDLLYALHDPKYVCVFLDGEKPLAMSQNLPWSASLRATVLTMQAGQLKATTIAMQTGVVASLANGFHHAKYAKDGGFCTFNGLARIAQASQIAFKMGHSISHLEIQKEADRVVGDEEARHKSSENLPLGIPLQWPRALSAGAKDRPRFRRYVGQNHGRYIGFN